MHHDSTAAGTIGGTLLTIVAVNSSTIATTVIAACIGATVSFFVSLFLKKMWMYFTKHYQKKCDKK